MHILLDVDGRKLEIEACDEDALALLTNSVTLLALFGAKEAFALMAKSILEQGGKVTSDTTVEREPTA